MLNKTTKTGSISRRRLLATVSAGAALPVSPFRINLLQAQEANIKIGFPVPLTGPYGTEAQDQVRAAQLAIAQFNDAGGACPLGQKPT
jgi:branched-chain amino acid transport system substrate-binding protein